MGAQEDSALNIQLLPQPNTNLTNGNLTGAAHSLHARPLMLASPGTIASLQTLHPAEPEPQLEPTDSPPLAFQLGHLAAVLSALAKGKVAKPSGWTYGHVCAAAFADSLHDPPPAHRERHGERLSRTPPTDT
jgi:hypothetical protein